MTITNGERLLECMKILGWSGGTVHQFWKCITPFYFGTKAGTPPDYLNDEEYQEVKESTKDCIIYYLSFGKLP